MDNHLEWKDRQLRFKTFVNISYSNLPGVFNPY